MNWMVGVEPNGKGQAVLTLEYLTKEGVWHREASLLAVVRMGSNSGRCSQPTTG